MADPKPSTAEKAAFGRPRPIDRLREAARLMRERAEVSTPAPWAGRPAGAYGPGRNVPGVDILGDLRAPVAPRHVAHVTPWGGTHDAAHIVSWHPGVALAVAAWLEFEARCTERAAQQFPSDIWDVDEHALAVADAYLGTETRHAE